MAKDKGHKKGDKRDDKPITTDSRFKSVHSDPRFKTPRFNNAKVKVDDRFSRKELDKLNAGLGGKRVKVDRYGRKMKGEESKFDKYFKEEEEGKGDDEEEEEEDEEEEDEEEEEDSDSDSEEETVEKLIKDVTLNQKKDESESESDSDSESDSESDTITADKARGEGLGSSSESDDSSSDSESEVEFEESDIELEESKPQEGEPSTTFAVVNMDWDNIQAVDLMATFNSFVPKHGLIKSITVYPSEFGKEQMQKEEIEGPPRELFQKKSKKKKDDDSDSDDEIDTKSAAGLQRAAKKLYEEDNGEDDYDSKALRRYQLQRLRYYYAVVECDSVSTAKNIYDSCDGTEYESTANIFDLRYVPEGMDFEDSEPRDQCTKLPSSYRPSMFVTDALQHSKVKLTWDETPKERLAMASRQFSQKEIEDMDFKAYLASDSEEEPEDNDSKNKYKMLLGGKTFGDKKEEDSDVDVEISFTPGLADQVPPKQPEEEEDTITAYKRKQKERRKARMDKFKERQKGEKEPEPEQEQEQPEKTKAKTKSKSKKSKPVEDEKSKAELELLMMNENEEKEDNHFNMKDIIKSEKKHKKKKKEDVNIQEDFDIDLNDDRFNEIFEDRDYNIDPTSTDFKKTKTMKKILDERSKRSGKHEDRPAKKQKKEKPQPNELGSLVEKLKRKHK